ncbi:NADH dehydrogenase-like protein [Gemmata obscuriglobus]|uniref:NAD(P)/FAD-dependent oxidoreductase n=1 Tax=Gemmata obscuriglobus TaxID=114 RepID=UPI00016C41E9|nr:NAD(P)/FAD-dependent oxidoreductase [Gemmata obscuriglobus]QEG28253.1 NADH dehydrogenase-like protein [Gemmata obscuriglobus]VTS06041.1 fad-dependent pyridine nucleotide-disulfide oxidoreductase : NADH dehydrogenase (Ubiquinone) OS=Nostoc sp. PCC 7107 GN=Nos7107_5176 PE=4 SV=1: Pyr_redox_2: Pyr_redox: Pyr_redox [Gemmata obscuriglobus UQM 2246]
MAHRNKVVIVGGGFAGLYCAQGLRRSPVDVTLIDRRNFHLFQPLLYQVATGALSAANIAAPLRGVLGRQRNAVVLLGEVSDIDPAARAVVLADGDRVPFDTLVVAAGATHHYFGHDADWEPIAPGLKTVEDATEIRRKLLSAFERAERAPPEARKRLLTFVVVGGGPTGVEMAGSVRELARHTLRRDFRFFDPADARVVVVESQPRVLAGFHEDLSRKAAAALDRLGIEVINDSRVTAVAPDHVVVTAKPDGSTRRIDTETVIWAAGVKASPLLSRLAARLGVEADSSGHLSVAADCTVSGHPWLFVIGDCATFRGEDGKPLPGVAPVAMQQGRYVADAIDRRARALPPPGAFRYRDKGSMATVSRSQAVVDLGWVRFGGKPAWLTWLFVHILYLARFENRVLVLVQWAWNYVSRNRAARLITGELTSVSTDARHDARRTDRTCQTADGALPAENADGEAQAGATSGRPGATG